MKKSTKIALIVAGALVVTYLLPSPSSSSSEPLAQEDAPSLTLPACEDQDDDNCYWDADVRGKGTDFIRVDGMAYYPSPPASEASQ